MKWATFISCLFLVSFAVSTHLPRKYRDAESHDTISRASELSADEFAAVAVILFSQMAQKATYEEVHKMMDDVVALAKKCTADEHADPECTKHLGTVFLDEMCHEQGFAEKYGFTDCCAKVDPERNECFLAHKNSTPGFIPPYQKPDTEEACKKFGENKNEVLGHYLYEISIRYPKAKVVSIMKATHGYDHVMTTCCQAEDKGACFREKAPAVKKQMMEDMAIQKHSCSVMKKFGDRPVKAVKLAYLSQKFPKAELATLEKIVHDIIHIYEECCKGDTLECMLDREKLTKYVCAHQNEISSKLSTCCEKPVMERAECIVHVENDDKPADLSETVREFVDNKEVCQHYAENKDKHLANFINQYGKRHPELSPQLLVRSAKGYEELLESCCANEHPETCLAKGEEQLKKHIAETLELLKTRCDQYGQLGDYLYHNELLVHYVRKAPQLTFKEVYKYTEQFKDIAAKCCKMDDAHKLTCAEGYTELVIGAICDRHEENHINKQICKCCGDSYIHRRECFTGLGPDPEYHPGPFNPALFSFHGDYCNAELPEKQKMKQEILFNLMNHKPTIKDEELAVAVVDFGTMEAKCCAAADPGQCLAEEGPKLIERTKAALGEWEIAKSPVLQVILNLSVEGHKASQLHQAWPKTMKWLIFSFCLFWASFAEPESLTERQQTLLEVRDSLTHGLPFDEFRHLSEALIVQNVQRATYEEAMKINNDISELAKKCIANQQSDPECTKPLDTVLYDKLCNEQGLGDKYGFTECCGKVSEERKECFLSHKNATPGFLPPFQEPTSEELCKVFQEDSTTAMSHYLYAIARRNPFTSVFIPFTIIHELKNALTACCQESSQSACLDEKIPSIRKKLLTDINLEKHSCSILKTFGKRAIMAIKFVQLSQKFPKAEVLTIHKLAGEIAHSQEKCCKGDTLGCFLERANVIAYICDHQDALSSKLKGCCEKPFFEQNACLVTVENDDKPADLSPTLREFMDNEQLCPRYAEDQNPLLAEFVYQYARRHPEFSVWLILRLGEDYEEWLEKCCKTENAKECLSQGEEQLKKHISDIHEMIKKNCDLSEQMGAYLLHNALLVRYVKKAPQLSFEELWEYTKRFVDMAAKCCKMDEPHKMICVDRYADLVIGDICQRHEEHPINKQLGQCCEDSYISRQECFGGLGVAEEYVPPPFDAELLAFGRDICLAKPEDQQKKKQRLLVNLVKLKPTITDDQLAALVKDFSDMGMKCCEADNHEECFTAEGPNLIERTRASLGEN
ncbi:uncharacterized protein LOC121933676 [Sceloporus undulatus]|uniref:uncharacterized protein LOC121933676 n=1 Tax=Sceloporus undulatus TaxID=8520 RepID=UPI001C4D8AE4|nr:uncharacterized protein LOC121933676 [Sceloporus undulatus]